MSDPRQVPPAPGTEQRVSQHHVRPYREDAEIYARNREAGTIPYTEAEIDARIVANAADVATLDEPGPGVTPFLHELVAIFRHRVFREPPVSAANRTATMRAVPDAQAKLVAAERHHTTHLRRYRELDSMRRRMPRPGAGVSFTKPEWLLVSLLGAMAIEVLGSVKALEAAFGLNVVTAAIFAIAISVIVIVAADQFGNALASITRESRGATRGVAAALIVVAMSCGVWAMYSLAGSREANTEFAALGSRKAESGSHGLSAVSGAHSATARALERAKESSESKVG
jgi:hypothetical protein